MLGASRAEESNMGAAARDQKPHLAVAEVLLAVVGLILMAFPAALYANAMAMIDGYRASHGQAGVAGTAVVESVSARSSQTCHGTFTPADGGSPVEVRIEVQGRCEVGQEVQARLMAGRPSIFTGYDQPRAWEPGSNDWGVYVPLVVLFGLLSLPLVLAVVMAITALAKRLRTTLAA
jgi:hypothetical protein